MSAGLTWARNESDDRALSTRQMYETFLKIKSEHEEKYGKPLRGVRLSRLTLLMFTLLPTQDANTITTFGGVPIEIDESLGPWEFKGVYA